MVSRTRAELATLKAEYKANCYDPHVASLAPGEKAISLTKAFAEFLRTVDHSPHIQPAWQDAGADAETAPSE
jgi:hypothetical protein